MNPPGEPKNTEAPNPFVTRPAGTLVVNSDMGVLLNRFRRRLFWLTFAFIAFLVLAASFDIWVTRELVSQERIHIDQAKTAVIEQATRFRNEMTTAEQSLRQIIQNAEIQHRYLMSMASNATTAYSQVLSNNLVTAVLARNTSGTARSAEDDALAVRNNRRNAQEIEVELRLSLERTREAFRTTASNFLGTYQAELNTSLKGVKQRALEADLLIAQLKQVETEARKAERAINTVLEALRAPTPPVAATPVSPAPKPAAPAANPPPAQQAGGPGFTVPVTPRPTPITNAVPAPGGNR